MNILTEISENLQKRRGSLVYMGRCSLLRNENENAVTYLRDAVNEMPRMDKYKREAMYYLGNALELTGDVEGAKENYRQILVSMANYRDVPQRLSALEASAAQS